MDIHAKFIQGLIDNPYTTYQNLRARFSSKEELNNTFEELWPPVDYLLDHLNEESIIKLAVQDPAIAVARKLVLQDLRHIAIKNRNFLPYSDTLRAIERCVEFFDVCVRVEHLQAEKVTLRNFVVEEENPRERGLAYYHRYRYLYQLNRLMNAMPAVYLIPTQANFTMIDMMRFRAVPIFAIGYSIGLTYVDEYEQTPVEFFMHDINHARRQYIANERWCKKLEIDSQEEKNQLYQRSADFSHAILDSILVKESDSVERAAIKDLQKVILFEITHEDAEPFLPEVISESLQRIEGFPSEFEVPSIDPDTGLMDVRDTIETGISTLAYVRHKLQNGFYDRIDSVNKGVVEPKYRTSDMIAEAAYQLLKAIKAKPAKDTSKDKFGNVDKKWLLQRTTAYGPEIVHETKVVDPDIARFGTSKREVNRRTYYEFEKHSNAVSGLIRARRDYVETRPSLAEIRLSTDIILLCKYEGQLNIVLFKREQPPFENCYALPGGFLWAPETSSDTAKRVLYDKLGIANIKLTQRGLFDSLERDPRGRIASVVYSGEISYTKLQTAARKMKIKTGQLLFPLNKLPDLVFDHAKIIQTLLLTK